MGYRKQIILFFTIYILINSISQANSWCQLPKVNDFANKISQTKLYTKQEICQIFEKTSVNHTVLAHIKAPFEKRTWPIYKLHFLTPTRISRGIQYYHDHRQSLLEAEKKYGVPASLICAIIGVETNYGHNMGGYVALESLLTLGFKYPPRSKFFLSELEELLKLAKKQDLPILSIHSSYAGALGIAQFMPSTYNELGVISHHHHHLDLFKHHDDAIYSIAHFLNTFGWQQNQPIIKSVFHSLLLPKNYCLSAHPIPRNDLFPFLRSLISNDAIALYQPDWQSSIHYWLYPNFKILMHYNTSSEYALAVTLLAQTIQNGVIKNG